MKRFLYFLGVVNIFVIGGALAYALPASADGMPSTLQACSYGGTSIQNSLGGTEWKGSVTFVSGINTGVVEQGDFSYFPSHTLYETTDGPVGNYTGIGVWGQQGGQFCSAFVEPFPGTTNMFVFVKEQGTIAADGQTYIGYGHGQLYQCANAQCSAISGADGDTVSRMVKQD